MKTDEKDRDCSKGCWEEKHLYTHSLKALT
jgi:hypothetical protein